MKSNTTKSITLVATLWAMVAAALLNVSSAQVGTEPIPNLTISGTNGNVVLSWFGQNGVTYQLESSSDLTTWTNFSSAVTGTGNSLMVTYPIGGQSSCFFRLKILIPPDTTSAVFDPQTGVLTIAGDDLDNTIVVSRDAAGNLRVNGGAASILGGVPTVANTVLIQIFGHGGSDQISLDESNGPLPKANLFGEGGNDTLIGGSGADVLNGGPGMDTLMGRGGADSLLGGDDGDIIIGGDGNDVVQMGNGNDRFIWNPGDGTDVIEGGDGIDTIEINGGNGAEDFTITANGTRVRFDRINPAPFFLDIGTCENLILNANGGNDTLSCTGNLAPLIQITADGGPGDDTLRGSNGADTLRGGDNNDFIDGNQGNDTILLGPGEDVVQWDPGDGSDTIDGQDGNDRLLFNGSAIGEIFDASANGARVRFTRNIGAVVLDLDGIENLELNALGGADSFTVNDLTGTGPDQHQRPPRFRGWRHHGDAQVDTDHHQRHCRRRYHHGDTSRRQPSGHWACGQRARGRVRDDD
jgi:Ca2+-binding RTX toxin-like protein